MSEQIHCPLCDADMEYRKWEGRKGHESHFWSCTECPGLLMEFVDYRDTAALIEYLAHDPSNPGYQEEE